MPRETTIPATIVEALERRRATDAADGGLVLGPALRIAFAAANAARHVQHGLGTVPDGFLPARATGAVYMTAWGDWTADLAILQAPVANTLVEGRFFTWAVPLVPRDA